EKAEWQAIPPDEHNTDPNSWQGLIFTSTSLSSTGLKIDYASPLSPGTIKLNLYFPGKTEDLLKKFGPDQQKYTPLKAGTDCGCPRPETITRNTWCPDGSCIENSNPVATDVKFLIVHHTAGSNTASDWAAVVRSIWNYHVYTNGWADIGYNFLIDPLGNIYEGRADDTLGAHFSGHNSGTSGMALLGTYTSVTPGAAMLYALEDLLVWKACDKSIDPLAIAYHASSGLMLHTISGHRDGGVTECPGDKVYELLPAIRTNVNAALNSCSLGLNKELAGHFNIYPNPVQDELMIELRDIDQQGLKISCYDLNGSAVLTKSFENSGNIISLDVSCLSPGLYFLRLTSDLGTTAVKLIKI
ncbi:MAG: N-acetylmuramoyl-L-alanine amidase, partial [Sinomicrobium sp.]|nr:N-acetylmuramoyl-L-alanine amidase [Sinomicrobium sp.]